MKRKLKFLVSAVGAIALVCSLVLTAAPAVIGAEETEVNTLRVYGECEFDSEFPYDDMDDPFNLAKSAESDNGLTIKDFIVWNPAYMYHLDPESLGMTGDDGDYFQRIVVNNNDANEKVYLKQWYVPKYEEPKGCVWVDGVETQLTPDIVKEYTYPKISD